MRTFSSYGAVNTELNYYVPRQTLIEYAYQQLLDGHYITVWAPRQTGKTWVMQNVLWGLERDPQYERFAVAKINLQHLLNQRDVNNIAQVIAQEIMAKVGKPGSALKIETLQDLPLVFTREVLAKPLVLILDEFDALVEEAISGLAAMFRNIYINRQDQAHKTTTEKDYLLHGVALIGVRAVLGIENATGSPFNVQRSLHIPNLTFAEVESMFKWYEQDSGQTIDPAVIERLFYELQGQPGLTCWLGELLTETYNEHQPTITMHDFEIAYAAATNALPNNNIINIINKAKQEPYKQLVLEMFQTDTKLEFRYDDPLTNFLYMNGVIDHEVVDKIGRYLKFANPFIEKRLFSYFARELFGNLGRLYDPFEDLEDTITATRLNVKNLLRRYEAYLQKNGARLLKDAPRRTSDLRIYEAVYHFHLYMYIHRFLSLRRSGQVYPEFPTGNGQIDLIIKYQGQIYGVEVKSYSDKQAYRDGLNQAARYGKQLQVSEITLALFVDNVDEANRQKYEQVYIDQETGVTVTPVFVETGQ